MTQKGPYTPPQTLFSTLSKHFSLHIPWISGHPTFTGEVDEALIGQVRA